MQIEDALGQLPVLTSRPTRSHSERRRRRLGVVCTDGVAHLALYRRQFASLGRRLKGRCAIESAGI
jgi:hypothetical protein